MEIKIIISVDDSELAGVLGVVFSRFTETLVKQTESYNKKKGRAKKEAVEEVTRAEDSEETDVSLKGSDGDELVSTDDDGGPNVAEDDDTPEPEPVKKKTASGLSKTKAPSPQEVKVSLEGDLIPAFLDYATRHSREEARKILAKYGVKNVRHLPTEKFSEILKKLKG